jgi:hypothetical protein
MTGTQSGLKGIADFGQITNQVTRTNQIQLPSLSELSGTIQRDTPIVRPILDTFSNTVFQERQLLATQQILPNPFNPSTEQTFRIVPPKTSTYDYTRRQITPTTPLLPPFAYRDFVLEQERARSKKNKDKKKKQWWQTPEWWYQPYYWGGGKNQLGSGYVTFTGKEPARIKKYERRFFSYESLG